MSLPRGLEMKPLDQPVVVVALAEFLESRSQLFHGLEVTHPEQLLFEISEEAFDAPVAFRLAHERRRGVQSEKADLR